MKRLTVLLLTLSLLFLTGCASFVFLPNEQYAQEAEKLKQEIAQNAPLAETFSITDEDGKVWLTQDDLASVRWAYTNAQQDNANVPVVLLSFNPEGMKKFEDATAANIGRKLNIYLDDEEIFSAAINEVIRNGEVILSGTIENAEEAMTLVARIESTMA